MIVDDLNRPTPAARIMPFLLRHFQDAGIAAESVRILMASGTHGLPGADGPVKKVGREAAASCQLLLHDNKRHLARSGRTSFGTRVLVNREVVSSDFVVGIGGIYPNSTAGFGGGSKLALGILGFDTILQLHYTHRSMGWGSSGENNFRKDVDEIARMIRLRTIITLHVNAERDAVRLECGDHFAYYKDALAFARDTYGAPMPAGADVVISNAYPNDLSLTFVQMKGMKPLERCSPGVSRVAIGSCSEGLGEHGIFPFPTAPRFHKLRLHARLLKMGRPGATIRKALGFPGQKLRARLMASQHSHARGGQGVARVPLAVWLYRPDTTSDDLPRNARGIRVTSSWAEIVQAVRKEQGGRDDLKVLLYPCAPLQWLDPALALQRDSPPREARPSPAAGS